jgi:hypothetical protein
MNCGNQAFGTVLEGRCVMLVRSPLTQERESVYHRRACHLLCYRKVMQENLSPPPQRQQHLAHANDSVFALR